MTTVPVGGLEFGFFFLWTSGIIWNRMKKKKRFNVYKKHEQDSTVIK